MGKDNYGSAFLYAEDLLVNQKFVDAHVTIDGYYPEGTLTRKDGKKVDKPSISFAGKDKKLVLCGTNLSVIHIVTGFPAGKDWMGCKIHLAARIVKAFGADTLAIRALPPKGTILRRKINERLGKPAVWEGEKRLKELTTIKEEEDVDGR